MLNRGYTQINVNTLPKCANSLIASRASDGTPIVTAQVHNTGGMAIALLVLAAVTVVIRKRRGRSAH